MYPSCENLTQTGEKLGICGLLNETEVDVDQPIFDEDLEKIVSMTVFVLFGFIFVAGLIGNALVVIVGESTANLADSSEKFSCFFFLPPTVAFNPLMRSTTNILIINLAISDLMFVIMCIPFTGKHRRHAIFNGFCGDEANSFRPSRNIALTTIYQQKNTNFPSFDLIYL
jgi:hypothetical protein